MMPIDPFSGGTVLRRPALQSPNYSAGAAGWIISADGSAEFNNLVIRGTFFGTDFELNTAGLFVYAGTAALGNLAVSVTSAGGVDEFGNTYSGGVTVYDTAGSSAQLAAGILAIANTVDTWTLAPAGTATDELDLTSANGPLSLALAPALATIAGGPLNVDSLLSYGQAAGASVSVIFTSSGTFTVPAGVTTMRRQAWAGGGGGGSGGGGGGGAGEYAEEPSSSAVTPGGTITVTIGAKGTGGAAGAFNDGTAGGNTTISGAGSTTVTAHGGTKGNTNGTRAAGGTGSTNTIHHNGGSSGISSGSRGGAGGGGGYDGQHASSSQAGGNGAAGKAILTYAPPVTAIIAAVAGLAGTDAGGNAFAAGVTVAAPGIQAFKPGVSPTVVETWHDMRPLSNSFVGTITGQYPPQYRLAADGFVEVFGYVQAAGTGNPNGVTFATLPAGYRPASHVISWPVTMDQEPSATVAFTPRCEVATTGALSIHQAPTAYTTTPVFNIKGRFPLDNTGLITS